MDGGTTKGAVTVAPQNYSPGDAPGLLRPMPDPQIRAWIEAPRPTEAELLVRIRAALFQGYVTAGEMSVEEEDLLLDDWISDLSGFPTWAISEAFKRWRRENPNRKPTSGAVRALSRSEVRRLEAELLRRNPPPPEPEKTPVSREAAASILAEYGFAPKRMTTKGDDDAE